MSLAEGWSGMSETGRSGDLAAHPTAMGITAAAANVAFDSVHPTPGDNARCEP